MIAMDVWTNTISMMITRVPDTFNLNHGVMRLDFWTKLKGQMSMAMDVKIPEDKSLPRGIVQTITDSPVLMAAISGLVY